MKKNRIIKLVIIIFVLMFTAFVYKWLSIFAYNNGPINYIGVVDDGSSTVDVVDGMVLQQEFVNNDRVISNVLIKFDITTPLEEGSVKVELLDKATNQVLAQCTRTHYNIADSEFTSFDMGDLSGDIVGKTLVVGVTIQGIKPGHMGIYAQTESDFCTRIVPKGSDNFCTLINVIFGMLMIVILISLSWILFGKSLKIENVFLFLSLSIGFLMTLIIPAMVVPDEPLHMTSAYTLSNKLMGIEPECGDYLVMRYGDNEAKLLSKEIDRAYYNTYYERLFNEPEYPVLMSTANHENYTTPYMYIVPAIGLTICRLCGLNTISTYLICKWMNLILFSLIVYYAIKRMPFAKTLVAVWALFPIIMQQAGSFSYDNGILALSALVIALTVNFMYGPSYERKLWKYIDMILLILGALMLVPSKNFGIIPMAILPLMLVGKFLWDRRENIKAYLKEKKCRRVALALAITAILVVVAVVVVMVIRHLLADADGQGHYLSYVGQFAYPAGYYLKHPVDLIIKLWTTFWMYGEDYFGQMLGASLGWLEIEIPLLFVLPFFLLFLLASVRKDDESQPIGVVSKLWMVTVFLGICAIACAGMLLYWTPMSSTFIKGIQGRYFLPGLVLAGLCLRTKNASVSRAFDKGILCAIPVLYVFVFGSIFYYMMV